VVVVSLVEQVGIVVFVESYDQEVIVQLGRPRTLRLLDLHSDREKTESPNKGVNSELICAKGKLTCDGDGLETSLSCWSVLSTALCF
jgi:hypothetical protein